jgi:hypothetical protein
MRVAGLHEGMGASSFGKSRPISEGLGQQEYGIVTDSLQRIIILCSVVTNMKTNPQRVIHCCPACSSVYRIALGGCRREDVPAENAKSRTAFAAILDLVKRNGALKG